MLDALHPGDQVLVQPLDEAPALRPGDIVVVRHPYERDMELIKRVERIDAQGHLVLRSDNAEEGSDSRALGAFSRESVVGRVSACLHRRTL